MDDPPRSTELRFSGLAISDDDVARAVAHVTLDGALRVAYLDGSAITTTRCLTDGCASIETIDLSGSSSLVDIASLPALLELRVLDLGNCGALVDVAVLSSCHRLSVLNVSGAARVQRLGEAISPLQHLRFVGAASYRDSDISKALQCPSLTDIVLPDDCSGEALDALAASKTLRLHVTARTDIAAEAGAYEGVEAPPPTTDAITRRAQALANATRGYSEKIADGRRERRRRDQADFKVFEATRRFLFRKEKDDLEHLRRALSGGA